MSSLEPISSQPLNREEFIYLEMGFAGTGAGGKEFFNRTISEQKTPSALCAKNKTTQASTGVPLCTTIWTRTIQTFSETSSWISIRKKIWN